MSGTLPARWAGWPPAAVVVHPTDCYPDGLEPGGVHDGYLRFWLPILGPTSTVAYRTLRALRRKSGLIRVGQLTSAVVVAEFVHPQDLPFVEDQIEEGWYRSRRALNMKSDEDVLAGSSRALREGAYLLEKMADRAEPALARLLEEADGLEARVERDLAQAG